MGMHNAVAYPSQKASGSVSLSTDSRIAGKGWDSLGVGSHNSSGSNQDIRPRVRVHHHPRVQCSDLIDNF